MSPALIPLAVCAFVVNLGYGVVIPILPTLVETTAVGVGIFYGVFSASKMLSQVAGGVIADQRGAVAVLVAAVFAYATSLLGIANAGSAETLTAWRALEGVAVGLSYPCVSAIVLAVSEKGDFAKQHGAVLGIAGAGIVLGPISATLIGAAYVRPLIIGIAVAAIVSSVPLLTRRYPRAASTQTFAQATRTLFGFLTSPAFLLLVPPLAFGKLSFSIMQPLIPVRGAELGLDPRVVGIVFGLNGVIFALTQPPAAMLVRRFGARATALSALLAAVMPLGLASIDHAYVFAAMTTLYSTAGGFIYGANTALIGERYHDDKNDHAKVFAAMHVATDLGMIAAPILFMWTYGKVPKLAFLGLVVVGVSLAAAFIVRGEDRDRRSA